MALNMESWISILRFMHTLCAPSSHLFNLFPLSPQSSVLSTIFKPMRAPFPPKFIPTYRYQDETIDAYAPIDNVAVSIRSAQHVDKFIRDCKESGVWSKLLFVMPFIGNSLGYGI